MKKENRIVESFQDYFKNKEINENDNLRLNIGDTVGYHGREGEIIDKDGSFFIVRFEDTGEEESIEKEELYSQEFGIEENINKIQEERNYDLDSKEGQLEFLNDEMDALEKELEWEKDPEARKQIEQEIEELGQSIRDLENEEDDSVVESFAPQIDKRLEKRQKKSLELQEYKKQAMEIIQGRDYDLYDFEDKMYDAFMRGDDPKQFARDYVLDNEL